MLPNLIVIGAQKCGTSALHYYLSFHPEVSMSTPKELNFFIKQRNWGQGRDWYEGHFEDNASVLGESSPNYTAYPHFRKVPKRMHSMVPEAKLIYLVRDPIERIVSQYVHNWVKRRKSIHRKGLAATVLEPDTTYIPRSSYYLQLERFLDFYPPSSILVLAQDDLKQDRSETLKRVFRFLGIDESFYHPKYERLRHQTQKKERATRTAQVGRRLPAPLWSRLEPRIQLTESLERPAVDEELRRELGARLGDDLARFREFTGRDFPDWSI